MGVSGSRIRFIYYTYLITPWSSVHLEKLTGFQLVKEFPKFCGIWRFITTFTSVHYLSLSWASSIQSIPHIPHPTFWRFILILSSHICMGLPKCFLSLKFPHQNPIYASTLSHMCYMPCTSHSSQFDHLNNIGWGAQIINCTKL